MPILPQISVQIIPQLMDLIDKMESFAQLELLQVITHFTQKEELEVLERLHSWALKTLEKEGDPPETLQATCTVLSRLASSLSFRYIHSNLQFYLIS